MTGPDATTRRVLAGLCTDCGRPARRGRLLCADHSVRKNRYFREKMRASSGTGLTREHFKCGMCGCEGHDRRTCDIHRRDEVKR